MMIESSAYDVGMLKLGSRSAPAWGQRRIERIAHGNCAPATCNNHPVEALLRPCTTATTELSMPLLPCCCIIVPDGPPALITVRNGTTAALSMRAGQT